MKNIRYLILFFFCPLLLSAQNQLTSSPYSMYGIGEVVSGLYGQNSAMGGAAYGIRDPWLISTENPASLSGMDSMRIYAEASLFLKNSWYSSGGNNHHAFTGNFSSFLLGTRITKRLAMAVGVSPYTAVGYYFTAQDQVEGTLGQTVTSVFQGDGGLSKAFVGTSFAFTPNLSVGVNLNYYFGNVYHYETQSSMGYTKGFQSDFFHADFGLQYFRPVGKESSLNIGLVYGYRQKYRMYNFKYVVTSNTYTELDARNRDQYLPEYYGIGIGYTRKKMTYAVDYTFRNSSVITSDAARIKYQDSHEVRAGISFNPLGRNFESYWKQVKYKAGINVSTPYYTINNKSGINIRGSVGLALPMFTGLLNPAIFVEHSVINGKFTSKAVGMTVSFTLAEQMFKVKL